MRPGRQQTFGKLAAVLVLLFGAGRSLAWPVDAVFDVDVGDDHFEKLLQLDWLDNSDPSVATVEVLPSGELDFIGKKVGRTRLLLSSNGKLHAFRIRVSAKGIPPPPPRLELLESAKKACPGLKTDRQGKENSLVVSVNTEPCRKALRTLFSESDEFLAPDISLTFDLPELQAQLRDIEAALSAKKSPAKPHYLGAGLVLKGELTPAQLHESLGQIFDRTLGRVALDDRTQTPDAGVPTP